MQCLDQVELPKVTNFVQNVFAGCAPSWAEPFCMLLADDRKSKFCNCNRYMVYKGLFKLCFACVFMFWLRGAAAHAGETSMVCCFDLTTSRVPDLVRDFVAFWFRSGECSHDVEGKTWVETGEL